MFTYLFFGVRRRSCPFSHIQLEHDQLSEIGLHSGLSNRKLSATMKPDLDGRTVLALQSTRQALSETYREKSSDLAKLGLDPVRQRVRLVERAPHHRTDPPFLEWKSHSGKWNGSDSQNGGGYSENERF